VDQSLYHIFLSMLLLSAGLVFNLISVVIVTGWRGLSAGVIATVLAMSIGRVYMGAQRGEGGCLHFSSWSLKVLQLLNGNRASLRHRFWASSARGWLDCVSFQLIIVRLIHVITPSASIRAYAAEQQFRFKLANRIDHYSKVTQHGYNVNR
jgi:hypothetical protein